MRSAQTVRIDRTHYKEDRLEARVSTALKKLLKKAADLEGTTLTEFVVQSVKSAAMRVIQDHEVITLSTRDRDVFMHALLNPPEPNQRLRQAFDRYH